MPRIVQPFDDTPARNVTPEGNAGSADGYSRGDHAHPREMVATWPIERSEKTLDINTDLNSTTRVYVTPMPLPFALSCAKVRLYVQTAGAAQADIRWALYNADGMFLFRLGVPGTSFFQESAGLQSRTLFTANDLEPGLYYQAVTVSLVQACVVDAVPRQRTAPDQGYFTFGGGPTFPGAFDPRALTLDNAPHPLVTLAEF